MRSQRCWAAWWVVFFGTSGWGLLPPLHAEISALTLTAGLAEMQVLQREAGGVARPAISGTASRSGVLRCSVNGGPWTVVREDLFARHKADFTLSAAGFRYYDEYRKMADYLGPVSERFRQAAGIIEEKP